MAGLLRKLCGIEWGLNLWVSYEQLEEAVIDYLKLDSLPESKISADLEAHLNKRKAAKEKLKKLVNYYDK